MSWSRLCWDKQVVDFVFWTLYITHKVINLEHASAFKWIFHLVDPFQLLILQTNHPKDFPYWFVGSDPSWLRCCTATVKAATPPSKLTHHRCLSGWWRAWTQTWWGASSSEDSCSAGAGTASTSAACDTGGQVRWQHMRKKKKKGNIKQDRNNVEQNFTVALKLEAADGKDCV